MVGFHDENSHISWYLILYQGTGGSTRTIKNKITIYCIG